MWRVFWVRLGAPLFMRVVWASGGGAFSVYGPGACCVRRFLRAVVGCSGYGWGGLAAWRVFRVRLAPLLLGVLSALGLSCLL